MKGGIIECRYNIIGRVRGNHILWGREDFEIHNDDAGEFENFGGYQEHVVGEDFEIGEGRGT